ncbi:MAG: ABC transporter permease [Acidimicrobiia bacterium]|nr:ABC transporter permease [Acidimicrobiia bacterium]MCY4457470.1 ABC transporter permease [Acidimicrobiaceae bacterium]
MIRPLLVRREKPLPGGQPLAFVLGSSVALFLGAALLWVAGDDPTEVYQRMLSASFGDLEALSATINRAIPLALAGLAVAIAATMGLWNIGAEGQILFGATAAAWVAQIGNAWSGPLLIVAMLVGATFGGALWALGPAIAKAQIGVNEIITTLMLNEIAVRFVRYLINGPWKDPEGFGFVQAPALPDQSELPGLFERAHIGALVAVAVLAVVGLMVSRSSWGYELRIAGSSGATATYAGISLKRKTLAVLVLSGAVAGLAGGIELTGNATRLTETVSNGYGFAGIIVAALALMRPSGVALVAVLFGAVQVGGQSIKAIGVSDAVSTVLQALILFGVIAAGVLVAYRLELAKAKVHSL